MNLIDKLKTTSSSRLTDRIKSTEEELSRLVSAHDQAEAEAIAEAGEDVAYQKASRRAAELSRQVAEKRERLDRLRMAHRASLDREQEELIDDLRSKHEAIKSARDQTKREVDRLRAVEDSRHKKEVDRLDRRLADAKAAEADAAIALHEEKNKLAEKAIADAESSGDRNDLSFHKGCLQRGDNELHTSQVRRGNALARNVGA